MFMASVATHGHHPSIAIWTLFNEGWGIDLDDNPDNRRWLGEFFDEAKAAVPNSLVVDNSPCFPRKTLAPPVIWCKWPETGTPRRGCRRLCLALFLPHDRGAAPWSRRSLIRFLGFASPPTRANWTSR